MGFVNRFHGRFTQESRSAPRRARPSDRSPIARYVGVLRSLPVRIPCARAREATQDRFRPSVFKATLTLAILRWQISLDHTSQRFEPSIAHHLFAMSNISLNLNRAINDSVRVLESLKDLEPQVSKAADLMGECFRTGNKLLTCGNGGSAADASHFATELVVRFTKDRRALPAICLASDSGILTAGGNDYGFDKIFARQVEAFGQPGDVLICFTTS